jgi:hypothetical protein
MVLDHLELDAAMVAEAAPLAGFSVRCPDDLPGLQPPPLHRDPRAALALAGERTQPILWPRWSQ